MNDRPEKKTFDCVEMKCRGAEMVMAETRGMTFEEEVAYWKRKSGELRAFQERFKEEAKRRR